MSDDLERLDAVARRRRSVRAYLPQPVPGEVLRRVLDVTLTSPSNCNTQPWLIHIVSGKKLAALGDALIAAAESGNAPDHDVPAPFAYRGDHRDRQIDAAVRLFEAQGIARHDVAGRMRSLLRNYRFFGAPHIALFCLPAGAGAREAADCGQCMQTFMLALTAADIGCCAQGSLGGYAERTRRMLGIADDQLILAGVSFGYPDLQHETAHVRTGRCSIAQAVRFHDDSEGTILA